jgi:hypothetical protein
MKKLTLICGLLILILPLAAQTFDPAAYGEETFSGFNGWREAFPGEDRKFKIPALYSSGEDGGMLFMDPGLEGEIKFETEDTWPPMTSGQKVTLYFSARGPWVWDRSLDAIDYGGGRLVQAGEEGGPAGSLAQVPASNPSPEETASFRESPQGSGLSSGFDYGRAPGPEPRRVVVRISGKAPLQGRRYRLQVGSYSIRGNAARAAGSLEKAGLYPAFEQHQNYVRVVLPGIPGEDVVETARKIGGAGFSEVWCREEP